MKIIIVWFFISFYLVSNSFFQNIKTAIKSIDKDGKVELELPLDNIPNGISGDIIHYYNKETYAVINRLFIKNRKVFILKNHIENRDIPIIKTPIQIGDSVILGYQNRNSLLIAQNREIYRDTLDLYKVSWIHPDTLGVFLELEKEKKFTLKNIKKFSKNYNVGLIFIVLIDKIIIFDPISQTILKRDKIEKIDIKETIFFYTEYKFRNRLPYKEIIKDIINVK